MSKVKWIYNEPEEVLGIKRNKNDEFEVQEDLATQLKEQGRIKIIDVKEKSVEEVKKKNRRT